MALFQWSTTAASNATAGAINWAEGQAPSTVNDSARQLMADVATYMLDPQFYNYGDVPTYVNATQFTVPGNQTANYAVNRRIKATVTAGTIRGSISASAFTTLTTVTVVWDSGALDAGLSTVYLSIVTDKVQQAVSATSATSSTTQAVGDNSTNIATTAFVQQNVILSSRNAQAAAYSVVVGDRGKLIDCTTGTWALTMNPTTLGTNFAFAAKNSGTGVITLTPSTGTVDGAATVALNAGESCMVFCDGTNFETMGRSLAVGVGQTWQSFTVGTQRIAGTTYTNSSGRPITVSAWGSNGSTYIILSGIVNGVTVTEGEGSSAGALGSVAFVVPPGSTYSVTQSTTSISTWLELR